MSSVYVVSSISKSIPVIFPSDLKETDYSLYLKEKEKESVDGRNCLYRDVGENFAVHLGHWGSITVVVRKTGFGHWDTESAWRSFPGYNSLPNFWLASGDFDIRDLIPEEGIEVDQLINAIQHYSNTVVGNKRCDWTPKDFK